MGPKILFNTKFYFLIVILAVGASGPWANAGGIFNVGRFIPNFSAPENANIGDFRLQGKRIPKGSLCEAVLIETQEKLGRLLTAQEIEANLPEILKATGEALEQVWVLRPGHPHPPDDWNCFTGGMRVSTPRGPQFMRDLKVGDEVISIDLATNTPVVNRIHTIYPSRDAPIGRLLDLQTPIEVTGRHRFYSSANGSEPDFCAIEDLPPDSNIYFTENDGEEFKPLPRGRYVPAGRATVFDLQMEGEPRNFIVEGVLVHNVKM